MLTAIDKEKIDEIALQSTFQSNHRHDTESVKYGAEQMCECKNKFLESKLIDIIDIVEAGVNNRSTDDVIMRQLKQELHLTD